MYEKITTSIQFGCCALWSEKYGTLLC